MDVKKLPVKEIQKKWYGITCPNCEKVIEGASEYAARYNIMIHLRTQHKIDARLD